MVESTTVREQEIEIMREIHVWKEKELGIEREVYLEKLTRYTHCSICIYAFSHTRTYL